jgi:hypothetical protein
MRDYDREFRQLRLLFRVGMGMLIGATILFVVVTIWGALA